MENNKKENNENKQLYSDISGIGPLSTLIFTVVLTVLMYIVSKLTGCQ